MTTKCYNQSTGNREYVIGQQSVKNKLEQRKVTPRRGDDSPEVNQCQ